jgi:hypothetical protein
MKRLFVLLALAIFATSASAFEESDRWFNDGVAYYQHPCGWDAFVKYGKLDTPQNRRNYNLTLKHPEMCSKVFP